MTEFEPIEGQEAETDEAKANPRITNILGYQILWDNNVSQRLSVDFNSNTIVVNPELFKNIGQAEIAGATVAMRQSEIENLLRTEKREYLAKGFQADPKIINDICLWVATNRLQESEQQNLTEILNDLPLPGTYFDEAKNAFFHYLATGDFSQTTSEIQEALATLPVNNKTKRNPLNALADGAVSIERKLDYYQRYILPIIEKAQELDKQLEETIKDEFKPSTEDSEGEPINEDEILQRVYPFFGGYFREKVFDGVDWRNMRVVATPQVAERIEGVEIDEKQERKKYQFKGLDGSKLTTGPIALPLPAGTEIVKGSITHGLIIKRDSKGVHFIAVDERVKSESISSNYEFSFTITKTLPDFMASQATDEERSAPVLSNTFFAGVNTYLEELNKAEISTSAKAKRLAGKIREEFEYVNSDEIGAMLGGAGSEYFKVLESVKKADCDVANFYLIAQLRSLDIPARMVTGYYVTDKSFDFAPLAGTKHAWAEYFDQEKNMWTRIDATPPKREEQREDQDEEEKGGSGGGEDMIEQNEDGETSFEGDIEIEGLNLSEEQLAKFAEFLQQRNEEMIDGERAIEQRTKEDFLQEFGVSREEWEKVLKYISQVNQTKIPKKDTIDKIEATTLGEEWRKFFNLFLITYRLPDKSRRTITRQSLGDDLVDPSSVAIDLLSGSDDPYGFEKTKKGEKEIKLPIDFSNDFLLDLTSSMEAGDGRGHSLKEYQKMFVMSALYHGFEINRQLAYFTGELANLPFISNHLLSIHGDDQFRELTSGEKEITMTQLTELFQILDQTEQGAGDMVSALERYRSALFSKPEVVEKIKSGKMLKTLTILSDGNLWCSVCGKESCSYSLHTESANKSRGIVRELRETGVIVNAIGFTEQSQLVVGIFDSAEKPGSAVVVSDITQAVAMHHGQMVKSWEVIKKVAELRQL